MPGAYADDADGGGAPMKDEVWGKFREGEGVRLAYKDEEIRSRVDCCESKGWEGIGCKEIWDGVGCKLVREGAGCKVGTVSDVGGLAIGRWGGKALVKDSIGGTPVSVGGREVNPCAGWKLDGVDGLDEIGDTEADRFSRLWSCARRVSFSWNYI